MPNRALVFEDNPINSRLMTMFLEQSGYFVELALRPSELEQKISKGFEIVFVDTASPALGKDTLEEIIHRSKASQQFVCPPIVAVLNTTKETEIRRFLNMGMDGYITKPISVKSLKETIDRVRSGKAGAAPGEDVVDVEKLSSALGVSDLAVLVDLFEQFFLTVNREIAEMRTAADTKDFDVIRAKAHSIKGASRNLRLNNIGKLSEDIESQTKYPSQSLDLHKIITNLESAVTRVYNDFSAKYRKS
ncbi:MAG: response regulator [Deferribacteraceae bacterium]|jgi:DNA-binding response OmpR family regulator|nr:response regulator [Deferribacteraceae bacterium]